MLDEVVSVEVIRHFCQVATHRLGVRVGDSHHALVAGRVAKRLHALQVGIEEYMGRLSNDVNCDEVVGFLDFLRPRPPRFFAHRADHLALHGHLVHLFSQGHRRIRLWSAGCGTGEEAYGMALTVLDAIQAARLGLHDVDVKILATDISKAMLQRGSRGVFDEEQLRDVPRTLYGRYFQTTDDGMAIDDDIKDLVVFRRLNLTNLPFPMTGPLEVIFGHEGLAPLVPSAQERVLGAMKQVLAAHGLLFTGLSDDDRTALDDEDDAFVPFASGPSPVRQGHC
jgi:chemotaxis protein methyltransferase CheR